MTERSTPNKRWVLLEGRRLDAAESLRDYLVRAADEVAGLLGDAEGRGRIPPCVDVIMINQAINRCELGPGRNLGVLDRADTHYVLRELAPGGTVEDRLAATDAEVDTTHLAA